MTTYLIALLAEQAILAFFISVRFLQSCQPSFKVFIYITSKGSFCSHGNQTKCTLTIVHSSDYDMQGIRKSQERSHIVSCRAVYQYSGPGTLWWRWLGVWTVNIRPPSSSPSKDDYTILGGNRFQSRTLQCTLPASLRDKQWALNLAAPGLSSIRGNQTRGEGVMGLCCPKNKRGVVSHVFYRGLGHSCW